ncbi:hypothetical protein H312_02689 [Anncaliia algerae PRA339]|uniref:Glycoside hydrolase family 19 catalytic domain-containing protein n=1 Tax=Anncaliia algerae PRA339 TaxID=1288291 RepID=A0A059EYV3_9MICR|nr:hypothetical protein H312_02689 [Anncaliia algerae PRA339]
MRRLQNIVMLVFFKLFARAYNGHLASSPKGYHFAYDGKIVLAANSNSLTSENTSNAVVGSITAMGRIKFHHDVDPDSDPENELETTLNPITKDDYINRLVAFLTETYWTDPEHTPDVGKAKQALIQIYDNISDPNPKELLVVTSLVIYETQAFMKMHEEPIPKDDRWYSRGILQIYSEKNYAHIAKLTGNNDFIKTPYILSNLDNRATDASLAFWKDLIGNARKEDPDFQISWMKALFLLKLKDLVPGPEENKKRRKIAFKQFQAIVNLFLNEKECLIQNCLEFIKYSINSNQSSALQHRKKKDQGLNPDTKQQ